MAMAFKTKTISCLAAAIGSAAVALLPAAAAETGIEIKLNQAKILKLARPADTIVVGNPEIADAAVQNASTIVLTGKGFGVTNLVILDEEGAPVIDEQVYVTRQEARTIRVYRRAALQTLSCTPRCESAYKSEAEQQSDSDVSASQ